MTITLNPNRRVVHLEDSLFCDMGYGYIKWVSQGATRGWVCIYWIQWNQSSTIPESWLRNK